MSREAAASRSDYRHFYPLDTRWSDNDIYGHINNVVYYAYIDSAVNRFLIEEGGLDINAGDIVGFVVSSGCDYLKPAAYPDALDAGLRVDHLGNSSVRYGVGIFRRGDDSPCAQGFSVHVFVARPGNRPVPLPANLRRALETLLPG
ncbi:MAG: thioesterase family protein [Chromatocurvus sp.]